MRPLAITTAALLLSLSAVASAQPVGIVGAIDHRPLAGTRFEGVAGVGSGASFGSGSSGEGVRAIQQALVDMGFALPQWATGSYGELTSRAVRNFQVHASTAFPTVRVTGVVDGPTLQALATLAPPAGQRGQRGNTPSNIHDGRAMRIVVLKREHRTFVFDDAGKVTHIFLNAVGAAATPTPSAQKTVDGKLGKAECEALGRSKWGNKAVFGDRLVGLSGGGQELHGTAAPSQLGLDVSHGCVRHSNPDILTLFGLIRVGEKVAIVDRLNDARLGAPAPVR